MAYCAYVATDSYKEVPCSCGARWCFTCGEDDHRPAACSQVRAWNNKAGDSDLTAMYIRANTKKCPRCSLEIIKDEGCQHMKCTQCAHHFCWLCLGDYGSHNEKTGGFYACNKFEERVRAEGRSEDERRAMAAARSLKCYEMAFERHLNHKSAMETAERELQAQVEAKARDQLALTGASASSSFSGSGGGGGGGGCHGGAGENGVALEQLLQQLRSAVDQVVLARRVLAWSYVFKYYQFVEDESLGRELQLFDTYQGKLESMTEDLQSRLSDMSASSAAAVAAVARKGGSGGGGTGGGSGAPESFSEWRQGVVHLMGAVKSFAQNVVQFADATDQYTGTDVEWEVKEGSAAEGGAGDDGASRPVWSWRDDSGVWTPFSDENIRSLEAAKAAGDTIVIMTSGGRRYRVDLVSMRQENMETHGSRAIRRVEAKGPANWTCGRCSYHNAGNDGGACVMCEMPRRR